MRNQADSATLRRLLGAVLALVLVLGACGGGGDDGTIEIGLVTNNPNGLRNVDGFRTELAAIGYDEGESVTFRFADEPVSGDDLEDELQSFVDADVDLIFTAGTPTGVAAHRITAGTGIPVVFGVIADPISAGVVDDLDRPGGNMTGVKLGVDQARRIELLLEIDPEIERLWIPHNPDDSAATSAVRDVVDILAAVGVGVVLSPVASDAEIDDLLADPPEADALYLVPDSLVNARIGELLEVAHDAGMLSSGPSTAQVNAGAVMTYGFIHERAGAQAARIANQVLLGADPAETPIVDTESFLAVNLATAQDIGFAVPESVLQQAEVILRPDDGGG